MLRTPRGDVSIVVLAKDLGAAKTRLGLDRDRAEQVALHLALKTVRAALAAELSGSVSVVTSDPRISQGSAHLGATVIAEGRPRGINRAAALGRAHALRERPLVPVAVMVADLPLLRSHELDAVVAQFLRGEVPLYVPDHQMTGTTFLIHSNRSRPGLGFGRQSALMHQRMGYRPAMRAPRGLRVDLDIPEDAEDLMSGKWGVDRHADFTEIRHLLPRTQSPNGLTGSPVARRSHSLADVAGQRTDTQLSVPFPVKERIDAYRHPA